MKIKRIFASLSAQMDTLVSNMENHEVVAECAIADARQYTAKLNAQLKMNVARVEQFARQLESIDKQISQWQERAKRCVSADQEKALRCVQAMKNCERQRDHLLGQLSHTQSLETELREHLQIAEQKLLDLQHKKASLAARDARNHVIRDVSCEPALAKDTESLFLRWEEKVIADEYSHGFSSDCDAGLNASFNAEENREALQAELEALMREDNAISKEV